jgi:hypothetical protein
MLHLFYPLPVNDNPATVINNSSDVNRFGNNNSAARMACNRFTRLANRIR